MRKMGNIPVVLIIALMAASSFANGRYTNIGDWFMNMILMVPGIIIGLSFHEYAHALVAFKCGDPTPKMQGRLTINPMAHIDPIGLVCLLFIGFGWGQPVQINPYNFKHRRRDELMVACAGVVMNFILAIAFAGILKLFVSFAGLSYANGGDIIVQMIICTIQINLVLLVFNLIPIPPLDGFGVITQIFNLENTKYYNFAYSYGFLILLALMMFDVTDLILSPLVSILLNFVLGIFF